jgi:phosphoribosyl-ATP pyrophosphohydrolase
VSDVAENHSPDAPRPTGTDEAADESLGRVMDDLYAVLLERQREMPEGSYTAKLLAASPDKVLKKVGEEATEVVMAAKDGDVDQLRYEIGDLVYHLLVVMVRWGVTPHELAEELAARRR